MPASTRLLVPASCILFALIAGCGGGGSDGVASSVGTTTVAPATTVSGVAYASSALRGVLVTAYPVGTDGKVGSAELAHASTATGPSSTGGYSLSIGAYAGMLHLAVTAPRGAASVDPATGAEIALSPDFTLHADAAVAAPTGQDVRTINITGYTDLVDQMAVLMGGRTQVNLQPGIEFLRVHGIDPLTGFPLPVAVGNGASAPTTCCISGSGNGFFDPTPTPGP